MSQRFDGDFATFVRKELDNLCTEFINSIPYAMANIIQEKYPDLSHSNIMDAMGRIARPSDGAEEKSLEWFETSERNISCEFEEEFPDEDDFYDDDDDWDDDDNSDAYVAHVERVEQDGKSEAESRFFWRTVRWHDNGLEERVRFCRFDDYREGDPEDEDTFFYGESPDVAVVGYGNDEWVIVAE